MQHNSYATQAHARRYPDVLVVDALCIFEPGVIRASVYNDDFGQEEIEILTKQFGGTLCSNVLHLKWYYFREFCS